MAVIRVLKRGMEYRLTILHLLFLSQQCHFINVISKTILCSQQSVCCFIYFPCKVNAVKGNVLHRDKLFSILVKSIGLCNTEGKHSMTRII